MAYSNTKFQLTHLLQAVWKTMGQSKRWVITNGSQTTAENTAWAGIEEAVYEDNDDALINGTVIVAQDAGGAGAAPEGQMARITAYDATLSLLTFGSLTAGLATGDKIAIASPLIPLEDMIEIANNALLYLGDFDLIDTTLSFSNNQTEYALPATIRQKPLGVEVQTNQASNNNRWKRIPFDVRPAPVGQNWTLVVPQGAIGYGMAVRYRILHPKVTTYDSDISETIHPELAKASVVAHAYQWINNQLGGNNEYLVARENTAWQELEIARAKFPIDHEQPRIHGLPHWRVPARRYPIQNDYTVE